MDRPVQERKCSPWTKTKLNWGLNKYHLISHPACSMCCWWTHYGRRTSNQIIFLFFHQGFLVGFGGIIIEGEVSLAVTRQGNLLRPAMKKKGQLFPLKLCCCGRYIKYTQCPRVLETYRTACMQLTNHCLVY